MDQQFTAYLNLWNKRINNINGFMEILKMLSMLE